jgi:hypothetical protein
VNKVLAKINEVLPSFQQGAKASQAAREDALATEIERFFTAGGMKSYADLYGASATKLQPDQITRRNEVLEMADAILAGAKLQGRDVPLDDALSAAHESVSAGFKEQAIRSGLTKAVKSRSAGRSLVPSKKTGRGEQSSRPADEASLERKVKGRLKAVFG